MVSAPVEVGDHDLDEEDVEDVRAEAILIFDNGDLTHEPVVNKCCSSAKWVPIQVLEEGYGQRFGL